MLFFKMNNRKDKGNINKKIEIIKSNVNIMTIIIQIDMTMRHY